jgi:hypothetical protein
VQLEWRRREIAKPNLDFHQVMLRLLNDESIGDGRLSECGSGPRNDQQQRGCGSSKLSHAAMLPDLRYREQLSPVGITDVHAQHVRIDLRILDRADLSLRTSSARSSRKRATPDLTPGQVGYKGNR